MKAQEFKLLVDGAGRIWFVYDNKRVECASLRLEGVTVDDTNLTLTLRPGHYVFETQQEPVERMTAHVSFDNAKLDALLSGETITLPGVEFDNGETIVISGYWNE